MSDPKVENMMTGQVAYVSRQAQRNPDIRQY